MRRFAWASTLAVLGFFAGCAAAPRASVDMTESIRPIPLFRGLSETELDRVAGICSVRECPAGTPLITGKSLWTAMDLDKDGLDDLIIVSESGAVNAVTNPKPQKKD